MAEIVVLDSGPLGLISHPTPRLEVMTWFAGLVAIGKVVCIPEIADYEVRRELLRAQRKRGLRRLDQMKTSLRYLPITTDVMLKAAEFWADARKRGKPTTNDDSLDADVILAAQAVLCTTASVVIATTNPRHLSRFVAAERWQDVR